MNTDESEVRLVEQHPSHDRYPSTAAARAETSRPLQRPSANSAGKFGRRRENSANRSGLFSQYSDPRPHPSNRKPRTTDDFCLPGSQLTTSPKSIPRAASATPKPPLDIDASTANPPKPFTSSRPLAHPAEPLKPRFHPTQPRNSMTREKAEYNPRTLQEDRAKREGNASLRNSSAPAASDSSRRAHAINLDDDSDDVKPLHSTKTRQSPPRTDEEQPSVRRSRRDTNLPQNQTDRKDKAARASDTNEEDSTRGARGITTAEITYDGPRDLIFMYPPGERGNIRVTTEERERLKQHKYLNDSLIDFYLKFLETDLKRRPPPFNFATKFFSSFFFGVLRRVKTDGARKKKSTAKSPSIDYNGVKNWTRGFDIFSTDFVIVPICDSFHWSLIIVANLKNLENTLQNQQTDMKQDGKERGHLNDPGRPKIIYLDSMDPDRGGDLAIPIRHYLVEEWLARKKGYGSEGRDNERTNTIKAFRRAIPLLKPNVPVQNNEYDCGLYVLNNLSMFLNNTESFMAKVLQGDMDMKMMYGSGDITKLRKNMTFLMDLFEAEWNQNIEKSPQTPKINGAEEQDETSSRKKTPPLEEEESEGESREIIDVASPADEDIENDVHTNDKQVPCTAPLPFPEVEEVDQESDGRVEFATSSGQESCRSAEEHTPRSDYQGRPVEHARQKTVRVTHMAGTQRILHKHADLNIRSPSVGRIELSEEEPDPMECDKDAVEADGYRNSDTIETGKRNLRRESKNVQAVDIRGQQDDAVMSDSSVEGEGAVFVKKTRKTEPMDTGSESDDEEMEMEDNSIPVDIDDTGVLEVVRPGGLGGCQQPRGPSLVVRDENIAPLYKDDLEEVLDEGNGNDMEEPVQVVQSRGGRRRREVLFRAEGRSRTAPPLPGYAGGQMRSKDTMQHRRRRSRTSARFS